MIQRRGLVDVGDHVARHAGDQERDGAGQDAERGDQHGPVVAVHDCGSVIQWTLGQSGKASRGVPIGISRVCSSGGT